MASTRNKNTYGNYCADTRQIQKQEDWFMASYKFVNPNFALPCSGINVQHMSASILSNNSVDIENYLYGIGANNFVTRVPQVVPDINTLQSVSFSKAPDVYVPVLPPFLTGQRP